LTTITPWPYRDLRALPKTHLHLHFEGSAPVTTMQRTSKKYGVPLPDTHSYRDFTEFCVQAAASMAMLREPDDFRLAVHDLLAMEYAFGVQWLEMGLIPSLYGDRFGSYDDVIDLAIDAIATAPLRPRGVGLMITVLRNQSVETGLAVTEVACRRAGDGIVVSLGLADDEHLFPPGPFAECFVRAKEAGLLRTPHAGELAGPDSVWATLESCAPNRLQHGVRSIEDPRLLEELQRAQICLDVCPTSNVRLGVFPSIEEHPAHRLFEAGIPISINADDTLLFETDILHEYEVARTKLGFSDDDLAQVARYAIRASGAPADVKRDVESEIDRWIGTAP
jgi:adenosine deaminase